MSARNKFIESPKTIMAEDEEYEEDDDGVVLMKMWMMIV